MHATFRLNHIEMTIHSKLLRAALAAATICAAALPCAPLHAQPDPPGTQPGSIVISGAVPDEATKAALLGRLQELYGAGKVVDQISVGGVVAPSNWEVQVPRLMTQNLKSISKGQLVVEGTSVALRGEVGSEAVRQAIASDLAGALTPSYVVKNGLRISAATQAALDRVLGSRVIEFEAGSALITDSGKAILDEMADVLKKTNPQKVEVIGHTDNVGLGTRNLALSRARADSVKTYLVAKGIAPVSIATSGMGADQPVVPNTTEEGRRRNRRIEFRVSQ
ncbi:OmpA family protein [Noviherbaspirillum autotrophicum]|uniref:OmpA family protein n=1 Tax=Noviherbaspirillum autotrophicum TaxID=709839 RepID=UPI000A7F77FB|nr:OmpA family protein [Noviherbaspirillum autotrophicum]